MPERITTGFPAIDGLLGSGLPATGLSVITGGPGTGKTMLLRGLAAQTLRDGRRVRYVDYDGCLSNDQLLHSSGWDYSQCCHLWGVLDHAVDRDTSLVILDGLTQAALPLGGGSQFAPFASFLAGSLPRVRTLLLRQNMALVIGMQKRRSMVEGEILVPPPLTLSHMADVRLDLELTEDGQFEATVLKTRDGNQGGKGIFLPECPDYLPPPPKTIWDFLFDD
jgi:hypothetical protein